MQVSEVDMTIAKAYRQLRQGYPLPVDLEMELRESDIAQEELVNLIEAGFSLEECLDELTTYYPYTEEHEDWIDDPYETDDTLIYTPTEEGEED